MKVAINILPLESGHQTRGIGYYTKNLLTGFEKRSDIEIQEFVNLSDVVYADIVHYPWFDLFFKTLPFRKKFKTIITIHDVIPLVFPKEYPVGPRGKFNFYLQKLSLNSCAQVLTDSENSKKDIAKYLKVRESKIKVIPLAASTDFKILPDGKKLRIKRKFNLPDKFLLYVGDANFVKNLPFLIEGFNSLLLNKDFKELKLVLVGGVFLKKVDDIDHPELAGLKLFNQLERKYSLDKNIIRSGQIDTSDLVGFYNLATVYVQPSLYEGFGLPVLEAMFCGCPVISSKASSLPEVAGDAAIYFDPKNEKQLTQILQQILTNKSLRRKLSKLGLQQASKFSWEGVADETIKAYHQALQI